MTKIVKSYSKQKQATKALSMTSEYYSGLKIEDIMNKNRYSRHSEIKFLPLGKSNV